MCLAKRGLAARVTSWDLVRRVSTWTLLALSTPRATACAIVKLRVISSMLRAMMRALFSDVAAARWSRSVVVRTGACEPSMPAGIASISCRREALVGPEITDGTQPRLNHRHIAAQASLPPGFLAQCQTVRSDRRRFL